LDIPQQVIKFNFDIVPVACGRPRLGRFGTFNPKKTTDYKKYLTALLQRQLTDEIQEKIVHLYNKPITLTATFGMPIPGILIKKNSAPWRTALPTKKPDVDNIFKAVADVLSGIIYHDDSQITHTLVRKIYSQTPYVEITISEATIDTITLSF
jgi:Holliday junction resolvase RusA-like endonuclease